MELPTQAVLMMIIAAGSLSGCHKKHAVPKMPPVSTNETARTNETVVDPKSFFDEMPPKRPPMPADGTGVLKLTASLVDIDEEEILEFADRQPVWMRFFFINLSNSHLTMILPGLMGKGLGVEIASTPGSAANVRLLPIDDPYLDFSYNIFGIEPGKGLCIEVLLSDFLEIKGDGRCDIEASFQPVTRQYEGACRLSVRLPMSRSGYVDERRILDIVKKLNDLYDSERMYDRTKALQAIRTVKAVETMPLLERAINDSEPWVRSEGMTSLIRLSFPEANVLLEKARTSTDEYIRAPARKELDRRKMTETSPDD